MTQYLLSIHQPEGSCRRSRSSWPGDAQLGELSAEMASAGSWVFAGGLHDPEHRHRAARAGDGDVLITDGPFAEGKEHLGGFSIIDAPDLDAALDWGRQAPRWRPRLPIEVRPFQGRGRRLIDCRDVRPRSSGSSARSTAARSPSWSASSATSTSPRRRSRTRSSSRSQRWPSDGAAAQPGRLDHHHRPQPGDRPAAPRGVPRPTGTPQAALLHAARRAASRRDPCATTGCG